MPGPLLVDLDNPSLEVIQEMQARSAKQQERQRQRKGNSQGEKPEPSLVSQIPNRRSEDGQGTEDDLDMAEQGDWEPTPLQEEIIVTVLVSPFWLTNSSSIH